MSQADRVVLESTEFDLLVRGVVKHFQGTEHDHDQSTHGRGKTVTAEGGRMSVTQVSESTYRYEYGDFTITTNIAGYALLEDALEGSYYDTGNPPDSIEQLGEVALDTQWNQWEGNFAMRHLAAAMMGLDHPYASGGENFDYQFARAIETGERPDDPDRAEAVKDFLSAHAATTHAMLQAVADNHREFAQDWEGVVRRGMVVPTDRYGGHPLLSLYAGDTFDIPLSGFSPDDRLVQSFLRGGEMGRDTMQSEDDFVFSPEWRSVMFEFDTTGARTVLPANWEEIRFAARDDDGSLPRWPAPHEVVTQGKFRVTGVRDVEREFFRAGWTDDPQTEEMRVITIQQMAVYNPRSGTYDALPGFVTLPDGRVIPVEEAA